MKYSSRKTGLSVALLAVLLSGSIAYAGGGQRHGFRHRGEMRAHAEQELGLTAEQRQRMEAIHAEHREAIRAARERVGETNRALEDALAADPVDTAAVDLRTREAGEAHAALLKATTAMRLAMREVLTPEQRAKALELRTKARERVEQRRRLRRDGTE
jgi:periplasmic protein CpxP/Spy